MALLGGGGEVTGVLGSQAWGRLGWTPPRLEEHHESYS
jgi:hypothetical protein